MLALNGPKFLILSSGMIEPKVTGLSEFPRRITLHSRSHVVINAMEGSNRCAFLIAPDGLLQARHLVLVAVGLADERFHHRGRLPRHDVAAPAPPGIQDPEVHGSRKAREGTYAINTIGLVKHSPVANGIKV